MPMLFHAEPSSYRDREARVYYDAAGRVCRALSARALAEWEAVRQTQFFRQAVEQHRIVRTQRLPDAEFTGESTAGPWSGLLQHETIPVVSYPFEWSFGMLQDAALLQLDLLDAALAEDFTFKDGTAYNLQWIGVRPILIDVISLERHTTGQPWAGYRQFCQTFLYPLMLQAYKNVPFQPWLRGRLEGITPHECWQLLSWRDCCRRGVPTHVGLHAWLQSRRSLDAIDSAKTLAAAGFHKDQIRSNVSGLKRVVRGLRWTPGESVWSGYAEDNNYSSEDHARKENFVRAVIQSRRWKLVWDAGCNTGVYSRIAAENSDQVVAFDADPVAIERLYQSLKSPLTGRNGGCILPLVNNLVDLPSGLGWRGTERSSLIHRGRPELILCLALMHHLVIGHGIPLRELLTWLASLGSSLVLEFVTKDDPKVQQLLRGRRDNYTDYELALFEHELSQRFDVVRSETLSTGTRRLYFANPRVVP